MERYQDKKAVIIGGTSGMGLATAKMLLDGGARVLVTGRSQAGLESARPPTIIFAECAHFSSNRLGSGLSVLLEELLRSAGVFSEIEDTDNELYRLVAPLLRESLGNRGKKLGDENHYILILDGLDENRIYARASGMAILMNSLGDLHCPIVLTTRREHFIATFESLNSGMMILSRKHGSRLPTPRRAPARLLAKS